MRMTFLRSQKPDLVNNDVVIEDQATLAKIKEDAGKWAVECGLNSDLHMTGPSIEKYPKSGYGYVVNVKERSGKGRMGTARYDKKAVRSFWTIDGMITG